MTQRFNFLDLFGYLFPGAALLALLWLPLGLTNNEWPPLEVVSGVLALGLAYVLGHVLQGMAHFALPSTDAQGRYPSDLILDDGKGLPSGVKRLLFLLIAKRFGISVKGDGEKDEPLRARRASAFRLCRGALVQKGAAGYAEQYQGMYFLTRGLAAAFTLGAAYTSGWVLAAWLPFYVVIALGVILVLLILCRVGRTIGPRLGSHLDKQNNVWLWIVAALLLIIGGLHPVEVTPEQQTTYSLFVIAVVTLFVAYRCRQSSIVFMNDFAKAVYQDFVTLETQNPRNLFAELVGQRAFDKWLSRDPGAATAKADWEQAEAELKSEWNQP
jgi:hypothetical protein